MNSESTVRFLGELMTASFIEERQRIKCKHNLAYKKSGNVRKTGVFTWYKPGRTIKVQLKTNPPGHYEELTTVLK
ncbi:hypothetical protein OUZ56_018816 [Daphnia magna]|uniref:Uncharacterized protein n=1 Tax=Daphnia magna TaxID=35525 RepID=A0ABQ9ZAZ2_9CRUS|nr:hypothetical protein OUZ56_018816 [Daphnia magna]